MLAPVDGTLEFGRNPELYDLNGKGRGLVQDYIRPEENLASFRGHAFISCDSSLPDAHREHEKGTLERQIGIPLEDFAFDMFERLQLRCDLFTRNFQRPNTLNRVDSMLSNRAL